MHGPVLLSRVISKTLLKSVKAKKGKRHYFKIRPYTQVTNPATGQTETVYGKWSKVKNIKSRSNGSFVLRSFLRSFLLLLFESVVEHSAGE